MGWKVGGGCGRSWGEVWGTLWGKVGWSTYRVVVAEFEAETEYLVEVDGVVIEDLDVHLPFFEVVGGDEVDAWREGLVDLNKRVLGGGWLAG